MKTRIFLFLILLLIPILCFAACNKADVPSDSPDTLEDAETEAQTSKNNASCKHEYAAKCSQKCLLCGAIRTNVRAHTFDSETECQNVVCTVCGEIREQSHSYENVDKTVSDALSLVTGKKVTQQCIKCDDIIEKDIGTLTAADIGMPAVYIDDYVQGQTKIVDLTKPTEIVVKFRYESNSESGEDFECVSKLKVQGASSQYNPKKNYTIKLFKDDTLEKKQNVDFGWGKQNKYCLKANYIDSSHARNIVGARLSSQVAATRATVNSNLASAPNYGLIDGFPVIVYVNNYFYGIYTLNIPKDNWQFAMKSDSEQKQAILMAAQWSDSVRLKEPIGNDFATYGWDVEHCSTTDQTWIRESFNELIALLNCEDPDRIREELPKHLDIDAAIDNFLLTYTLNGGDNQAKNVLWATYDGKVWIPSMYDMDATFGMWWEGTPIGTPGVTTRDMYPSWNEDGSYDIPGNGSKMYHILIQYYGDQVEARWAELRESIITIENITSLFKDFMSDIPEVAYYSDALRWTNIPYIDANRGNMYEATQDQLARLDDFFYGLSEYGQ